MDIHIFLALITLDRIKQKCNVWQNILLQKISYPLYLFISSSALPSSRLLEAIALQI